MIKNNIVFNLNDTEKIIIKLEDHISLVHCCYQEFIVFKQNNNEYLLAKDSIRFKLQCFVSILSKALENKLLLHKSIISDIGYSYNEHRQGKAGFVFEKDGNNDYETWVGYKYLLWGYEATSWIYNDNKENIIFEITPRFPGKATYPDPAEQFSEDQIANSLWYEEWIKDYKPILIRVIPRATAQQWLDQANQILEIIEENINRMRAEGTL